MWGVYYVGLSFWIHSLEAQNTVQLPRTFPDFFTAILDEPIVLAPKLVKVCKFIHTSRKVFVFYIHARIFGCIDCMYM